MRAWEACMSLTSFCVCAAIFVKVLDAAGVERTRPAQNTMDLHTHTHTHTHIHRQTNTHTHTFVPFTLPYLIIFDCWVVCSASLVVSRCNEAMNSIEMVTIWRPEWRGACVPNCSIVYSVALKQWTLSILVFDKEIESYWANIPVGIAQVLLQREPESSSETAIL